MQRFDRDSARGEQDDLPAMLASILRRVEALELDLNGLSVVTEAATGAYACTATIAAVAGARRVSIFARDTRRHGSASDAFDATLSLARHAGVADRITMLHRLEPKAFGECDILTNSGHLRPISDAVVAALPPGAVIALMFEAWEFRSDDLDLAACRRHGVPVAAVNERHPHVAVFPFLGPLALKLLEDADVAARGSRILVICDNPFAPFICSGLNAAGARVTLTPDLAGAGSGPCDAVVLALDPGRNAPFREAELRKLAALAPNVPLAQFWGDIDRAAAAAAGFILVPRTDPRPGHMGILLNALGPEPIIRLQTGGLKAAELVHRGATFPPDGVAELL